MKNKQIKEKINNAFSNITPDDFDKVVEKCSKIKKEEYVMNNKSNKIFRKGILIPVLVVLVIGIFLGSYEEFFKVNSIVTLDVNPSIELKLNRQNKIVKYNANNNDAKKILDDMDLKNVHVDTALNAIIGSMVTKGYLNDTANSILVTVDGNNKTRESLRKELVTKIDKIMSSDKLDVSILSQTIDVNDDIKSLANKYNISLGKATLIKEIVNNNSLLTVEDLINLSINELNLLIQNKNSHLNNIDKLGTASTKSYIGEDKAKEIVLNHAKVTSPNYFNLEMDVENGIMVYDIEFIYQSYEYDYEVNALTGDIIKNEKELKDNILSNNGENNNDNNSNNNTNSIISESKAKEIALNHAKVTNPKKLHIEYDREDNEYSVEFEYNGKEYDYEIEATSGRIKDYDIELKD